MLNFQHGLCVVNSNGVVWRVHRIPKRRLDRWLSWNGRRLVERVLAVLHLPIPVWAQTAVLVMDSGDKLRLLRDVDSVVTWVPDDVNTVPPEGMQ